MAVRGIKYALNRFGVRVPRLVVHTDDTTPVFPAIHVAPTSAPSGTAAAGDFYFDSTQNKAYWHNGTFWASEGSVRKVEVITAATDTWTEADSGTLFVLSRAAGQAITLPALATADVGITFDVVIGTTITSNTTTLTAAAGDLLLAYGAIDVYDTDTSNAVTTYAPDGSDDLIITLNGTTTGGILKTRLTLTAISDVGWYVTGRSYASGVVATPFS